MMDLEIIFVILAMALATYPARLLPALLILRARIPDSLTTVLQIMPFCIMISMIVIDIFDNQANAIWRLLALALVFVASWAGGNVGLGVLVGIISYSALLVL